MDEAENYPQYGYPSVESLVFTFIKASHLAPKSSSVYTDVRELVKGKRRFFAEISPGERKENADDFPGIAGKLEKALAEEWATPEMVAEISYRLKDYIRTYLTFYVRRISAAQLPTIFILKNIQTFYFAPRLAVDLSWLEQKWGIGLLPRLLSKETTEENPIGVTLRRIRKLESFSLAEAARRAGDNTGELENKMFRWESGANKPRKDSFDQLKAGYGLDTNSRYGLWTWIALVLDQCEPEFRRQIAAYRGHGFDVEAACTSLIQLSNNTILQTEIPESFRTLSRLLCNQASREPGDYELALQAIDEFEAHIKANNGKCAYHLYAMKARIAVFSKKPKEAQKMFLQAIDLARYAEPIEAERLLRSYAALCARERYKVPLKHVTDIQWLLGFHPLQKRQPDIWADETEESVTETKRVFDYYRYFPPQSFFDFIPDKANEDKS
jgi:transcriptional regulator with XRE-family HTH domain